MDTATLTEEAIAQSLAQDRPTIDAAIKTYMSWIVARSLTQDEKVTNAEALSYARVLLKAINGYKFDISKSTTTISGVVAQVWNGLVESDQKPSRFLGRVALLRAWDGIVASISTEDEQTELSLLEFGELLKDYKAKEPTKDSKAHLIWDEPGAELERRRQRRTKRAEDNKKEEREQVTPFIEELTEEDEEEET